MQLIRQIKVITELTFTDGKVMALRKCHLLESTDVNR